MVYPKAIKLPSGSWTARVRIKIDGKMVDKSFTRPTKKEAIASATAYKMGIKNGEKDDKPIYQKTVSEAVEDYICMRLNVASPATIRGYRIIQRYRFKDAQDYNIAELTPEKWQRFVNEDCRKYAPKTIKNAWGFYRSVIKEATGKSITTVRVPLVMDAARPYLTPEQVPNFVNSIKGKSYEIPALCALSGLRRSEIYALTWDHIDLKAQIMHISGAAVLNADNELIRKKENKNQNSQRTVPIIPPLQAALQEISEKYRKGLVVNVLPNTVFNQINSTCMQLGFPKVGYHGLRRTFASLCYHLGIPEEVTMKMGGWSNIYTMRKIYTYVSERDIAVHSAAFQSFFDKNGNENDNIG